MVNVRKCHYLTACRRDDDFTAVICNWYQGNGKGDVPSSEHLCLPTQIEAKVDGATPTITPTDKLLSSNMKLSSRQKYGKRRVVYNLTATSGKNGKNAICIYAKLREISFGEA